MRLLSIKKNKYIFSLLHALILMQFISIYWSFRLFILFTIITLVFSVKSFSIKKINPIHATNVLMIFLYFFYTLSLLWSSQKNIGLSDLETKFSLLFFPFYFTFTNISSHYKFIIRSFVWASIITSIVLLSRTFYHLFVFKYFLFYTEYSFNMHPSYLAMYLSIGFLFLMEIDFIRYTMALRWLGGCIIALSILFAASKAGIIVFLLITTIYFIINVKLKYSILGMMVITTLLILVYHFEKKIFLPIIDRFSTQIETSQNIISHPHQSLRLESNSIRYYAWLTSLKVIKENFWTGVGCGDVHLELNRQFKNENLNLLAEKNINSHNQFLNTFVATGIIGFLLLIGVFISITRTAFVQKNRIIFFIATIFLINFLFESMLETEAGTIFTGYIISFISSINKNNKL